MSILNEIETIVKFHQKMCDIDATYHLEIWPPRRQLVNNVCEVTGAANV